jgi:hypothetical protein
VTYAKRWRPGRQDRYEEAIAIRAERSSDAALIGDFCSLSLHASCPFFSFSFPREERHCHYHEEHHAITLASRLFGYVSRKL